MIASRLATGDLRLEWRRFGRTRFPIRNSQFAVRIGFTLIEVLLSITIAAILAVCVVSSTRAITQSRNAIDTRSTRVAEARRAMEVILGALRNARRDPMDRQNPLLIGRRGGPNDSDRIDLQVMSDRAVRSDSPESDQQEVGFYLQTVGKSILPSLMCRRDHGLDEHMDEGGIATVVAQGIVGLNFEYYTAGEWQHEWPTTELQPPRAVRVTLTAASEPDRSASHERESRRTPDVIVLTSAVTLHANQQQTQEDQQKNGNQIQNQGQAPAPTVQGVSP